MKHGKAVVIGICGATLFAAGCDSTLPVQERLKLRMLYGEPSQLIEKYRLWDEEPAASEPALTKWGALECLEAGIALAEEEDTFEHQVAARLLVHPGVRARLSPGETCAANLAIARILSAGKTDRTRWLGDGPSDTVLLGLDRPTYLATRGSHQARTAAIDALRLRLEKETPSP